MTKPETREPREAVISDPLVTVADAAGALAVSEKHMRRMIETRQIPHVRLGRAVRVRRSDLESLVDAHTVAALDWDEEMESRR